MKKIYKIYQTNFDGEHDHDFFLKLDDQAYISLTEAEKALEKYFQTSESISDEFTILPLYIKG